MAGHSHSHNIAKRKGVQDAKRSKEFTAVAHLISNDNPALRLAIDKARLINMPNANVRRAIERGAGKSESGLNLEERLYEGYGPHGVGFLVLVHTDNKQRTVAEIRSIFSSFGGTLADPGAASYLFHQNETEYDVTVPLVLEAEQFAVIEELFAELENHDDVDGVWHNGVLA